VQHGNGKCSHVGRTRTLVGSDHRERRTVVVLDGGAFAEKFRLEAEAEIHVGLLAAFRLEARLHDRRHAARLYRRAHDDRVGGDRPGREPDTRQQVTVSDAGCSEQNVAARHFRDCVLAIDVVEAHPLDPDGAMVTVEDVTERSRLDAVRTDFVANISHELKTPIGALAVLAETLIDETDPAVIGRLADRTVNEAHRVAKIIDDLLELSRIELSGDLIVSSCDVGLLVVEAASRNSFLARQNKVAVDAGDIPVGLSINADHAQITSALGNLVDNAVKYSDANGVVNVTAKPDQQGVTFVVSDNGIGIPSHDLDRIFDRFYRVDRARSRGTGGTGLGLSIVRHVANNHGGSVTVESHEGEGSTFRLYIPERLVPQT
jgi:two-component system sensor histidine kinase SenX3